MGSTRQRPGQPEAQRTIDATAILIRYCYYGDANVDGAVDTIDFNLLAANFSKTLAADSATASRTPAMPFGTAKILEGSGENLISLLDAPLADV